MIFSQFVQEHRPTISISVDSIRDVCNRNAIGIGFDDGYIRLSKGQVFIVSKLNLIWYEKVDGLKLIFIPQMIGSQYTSGSEKLAQLVLDELNITKVEVDLPERVVKLPVPDWVGVISDDYYWGYVTRDMFVSEAAEAVEAFNAQIRGIVGE